MTRRRDNTRAFTVLDSSKDRQDIAGFWFVLWPTRDPIGWKTLEYYAAITPNVAQRQAILAWLREHPCPGQPVPEQLEMEL